MYDIIIIIIKNYGIMKRAKFLSSTEKGAKTLCRTIVLKTRPLVPLIFDRALMLLVTIAFLSAFIDFKNKIEMKFEILKKSM